MSKIKRVSTLVDDMDRLDCRMHELVDNPPDRVLSADCVMHILADEFGLGVRPPELKPHEQPDVVFWPDWLTVLVRDAWDKMVEA